MTYDELSCTQQLSVFFANPLTYSFTKPHGDAIDGLAEEALARHCRGSYSLCLGEATNYVDSRLFSVAS